MADWTDQWADGRATAGSVYRLEYVNEGTFDFAFADWPDESVFTFVVNQTPGVTFDRVANYSPWNGTVKIDVLVERTGVLGDILRERIVATDMVSLVTESVPFVGGVSDTTWKLERVKYLRHESSGEQAETEESAEQFEEDLGEGSVRDAISEGAEFADRFGKFASVGAVVLLALLVFMSLAE